MRWQKDPTDVPTDGYLEHPVTVEFLGAPKFHNTQPDRLIGPHTGRELNLMIMGLKPVALIEPSSIGFWVNPITDLGWIYKRISIRKSNGNEKSYYAVAQRGQMWRIEKLSRIYDTAQVRGGLSPADHARVGYLLGYTKKAIHEFLVNNIKRRNV